MFPLVIHILFQTIKQKADDTEDDSDVSKKSRGREKAKKARKALDSSTEDSSDQAEILGKHIDKVVKRRLAKKKR